MKEYLLKQLTATYVLFSIACKINLGLVKNNGNPGGRGGGVFGLGNPGGRGGHSDPGNPGGRGGQKTLPSVGGVWSFSGITQYNEPQYNEAIGQSLGTSLN